MSSTPTDRADPPAGMSSKTPDPHAAAETRAPAFDFERLTIQQWFELLKGIAFGPGLVDVVTLGPDPRFERASNFVLMGLRLHDGDGARVFDTACVLSPPTWPGSVDLRESGSPADEARTHVDRVEHRKLPRLDSEELLGQLRSCPDRSIVYVPAASHFRYRGTAEGPSDEEAWVAQLIRLVKEVRAIVGVTRSYVLLDTGRFTPVHAPANKLLADLECGHVGTTGVPEDTAPMYAIVAGVGKGDVSALSQALAAIADAEPSLGPAAASLQRALALYNSGRHLAIWPALSPHWEHLLEQTSSFPESRVELARIAAAGAMPDEARRALASFEVDLAGAALLEKVLLVSSACNERALEAKVIERLEQVFPRSRALSQHRIKGCLRTGDHGALTRLLSQAEGSIDPEEHSYLTDVADYLHRPELDYVSASEALVARHPARESELRLLMAREAARRSDHIAALQLCASIAPATVDGWKATHLAITVFESVLLLQTEDGSFVVGDEELARLIAILAQRIATSPHNAALRREFSRALSIEVLGARGAALLSYLLLALRSKPVIVPRVAGQPAGESELKEFLDLALELIKPETTVTIGAGDLPDSFDIERARKVMPALPGILEKVLDTIHYEQGIQTMQLALHASLLVCKRAGDRLLGMMLFQIAAIHLATTGWAQLARDMADHGLVMVGGDDDERRVAWGTFADVYHRIGDLHEALIGALCAISFSHARVGAAEAWQESFLLIRLFRDLGLCDEAEAVLSHAIEPLGALTPPQTARIESLRLSIEHRRFEKNPASDEALLALIRSLTANLRQAVDLADDVLPPLVLLTPLLARARSRGLDVSSEAESLLERAMALVPPNLHELVAAFGAPRPTLADLQRMTTGLSKTRLGDDVAYDLKRASLPAKRALAHADQLPLGEVVALLDLLSDRALAGLEGRALIDPQRLEGAVAYLLQQDHDVHVMALDERARLVRLTFSRDRPTALVFEPEEVFSATRFEQWKQELPFKYARMDRDEHVIGDAVRRSVDQLGISEPPSRSTVVVCDVELQPFPSNLLRYQDEFVGALHPVAMAPSLDWVAGLIGNPRPSNGRAVAWVSDGRPADDPGRSVLGPLADRLEPVLTAQGVTLLRSEQPPPQLENADLAIVLAHGGLVPGQRFFRVLRDDHDQQWAPREIGWALGAAGIVVLFVCSAGRLDEHPRARTTIGLARRLLGGGCRAVVACPWPLAVAVPPHWLPPFLDALHGGAPATRAVFAANQELVRRFSGNPPHAFAMHLYGDASFRLK